MHARTCKQYIFWSYGTPTFNGVLFDENPLTCSHAGAKKKEKRKKKEEKNAEGFEILYFYWSFSSDIMAAKGLII